MGMTGKPWKERHLEMPEPPPLVHFDGIEQRLYFESNSVSQLLTLSLESRPATLQRRLISIPCTCYIIPSVTARLLIKCEGWNTDGLINWELYLPGQLSLYHNSLIRCPNCCRHCTNQPVYLTSEAFPSSARLWAISWDIQTTPTWREQSTPFWQRTPQTWRCWL